MPQDLLSLLSKCISQQHSKWENSVRNQWLNITMTTGATHTKKIFKRLLTLIHISNQ